MPNSTPAVKVRRNRRSIVAPQPGPSYYHTNGDINSYQVTSTKWNGPEDDTEQIFITNCQTNYTGVAIRASDSAGIHHVYINGVITKARPDTP